MSADVHRVIHDPGSEGLWLESNGSGTVLLCSSVTDSHGHMVVHRHLLSPTAIRGLRQFLAFSEVKR